MSRQIPVIFVCICISPQRTINASVHCSVVQAPPCHTTASLYDAFTAPVVGTRLLVVVLDVGSIQALQCTTTSTASTG